MRVIVYACLLGEVALCPAQIPVFHEQATVRGVSYFTPDNFQTLQTYGKGLALNDLDGDGDLDLLTTGRADGRPGLFLNLGTGFFQDLTDVQPLPVTGPVNGISLADYDGDMDLDAYFTSWLGPNFLLRNDGGLAFTDVTASVAPALADLGVGNGSCWGDFNGDGWLDLFVGNRTPVLNVLPNLLFVNQGGVTFQEVGSQHGIDSSQYTFQGVWVDYDLDGDLDLYVSNDKGSALQGRWNRLYENQQGTLVDVSVGSGTNVAIDSMGVAVGDLDGNGFSDFYCTNTPAGNPLLMNQGNGVFLDQAAAYHVAANETCWGTHFFDQDNDGRLELFVATVPFTDLLFRATPAGAMQQVGSQAGLLYPSASYCSAVGDIDGDGDLDLVVQQSNAPVRLFVNQLMNQPGPLPHHLVTRLQGTYPNRHAIGARVTVSTATRVQTQQLLAGVGYKSSSSFDLHWGLAAESVVTSVQVVWPGGQEVSVLPALQADQLLVICQPSSLLDCDGNQVPDSEELFLGIAIDSNHDGRIDSCEQSFVRGDCNDDGAVDLSDVLCVLMHLFAQALVPCHDAIDADDDGAPGIVDALRVLGYLFDDGKPLSAPFPGCGLDPTGFTPGLSCALAASCP